MTITMTKTEERLRELVEKIEALELEKAEIASIVKQTYDEAKAEGFDTRTLRQVIKLRKMEPDERQEQESLLYTYMQALGMIATSTS